MIRNYLIIALRNLLKNGTFSLINILGLAIGIASTLLISHYVNFERSYEHIHKNADNIFRITLDLYNGSEFIENDCEMYQTIGPEFKEKMPEVLDFVRMMNWDPMQITANQKVNYEQSIYMADPSVFTMFSYGILQGDPYAQFDQPYKSVVTESIAMKYFGRLEIVGETFRLGNSKEPIEIVGVMEDVSQNTHLKFDILISHATIPKFYRWYEKYPWNNNEYTYLLMTEGIQVSDFNKKLKEYSLSKERLEGEIIVSERIKDIHLYSNKTFEPEVNGSAQTVNFMSMIAIFIMIIAWVNYINLSTARATERAREVGIRKVVGSSRNQLIGQFMLEAFLVNMIAATLAYTFVQIGIPFFKELTGQPLAADLYNNTQLWLLLLSIVAIGTILSGIYPALVLSSFKPVVVLKGKFRNSAFGIVLRKGLIVFQFLATVVLMSVSLSVYQQIDFLTDKDLGVDLNNTIALRAPQLGISDSLYLIQANAFKNIIESHASIEKMAISGALSGGNNHEVGTTDYVLRVGADENENSANYHNFNINHDFLSALDLQLAAGKNFVDGSNKDMVIINERAVETLGFQSSEDAVGKHITYGGNSSSEIIGVVKNYHQRSPKEAFVPMIFYYSKGGDFFLVKYNQGTTTQTIEAISKSWQSLFDGAALEYFFLNDRYNQQYESDRRFSKVTALFTILSIIIAILGLFGLSSFTILQRTKEIGVRKVLGASVKSIVQMLSKDFLKLIVLSGMLAVPVAYFLIQLWLENYANKIPISWGLLVFPLAVILGIAFLTILGQTIRSATANPVDSLKYE